MNSNISDKDKKDWENFLSNKDNLFDKDSKFLQKKTNRIIRFDLHGYSLDEANKLVHHVILSGYENNIKKIKIITGKGLRSKNKDNPYQSKNLSILKYSVPEYINSSQELLKVIKTVSQNEIESFNEGSFEILLKKKL